jgi:hypothetical protein
MKKTILGITVLLVFFLFGFQECVVVVPPSPGPTSPPSPIERASVGGKYTDLLRVIDVPDDRNTYGDFYDLGYQKKKNKYKGYSKLPAGYWVYVYPSWYIWKTTAEDEKPGYDYDLGSANGKYDDLKKTLYVPDDENRFGSFYDWGYRTTTSYAGFRNIPRGYWVYAAPYWYIWEEESKGYSDADKDKATVDGKYSNLLTVIEVSTDRNRFGTFYDWGYRTNRSYAGYSNLPKGYWVYVYPNWFIWGEESQGYTDADKKKARVDGKYSDLLEVIRVESDKSRFGTFYDWGYRTNRNYAGYSNLPKGYWVYVYPNWFIWEDMRETPGDEDHASVNGKYEVLMKTLYVPTDKNRFGDFYDYGYTNQRDYAGYSNLPPGYWVYSSPYWYIWRDMVDFTPTPDPGETNDPTSAYGKYYDLLKEIYAPFDIFIYGDYYDRGYSKQKSYAGETNIPAGYWVYSSPNWYVWEHKR